MKIFLVDKSPARAAALADSLKAAGYANTLFAFTCEDASSQIVAAGGVDLLISEVITEGMDGFTLRESLAQIFPSLKVIFTSEYDLSDYAERVAGTPVFYKPFEDASLVDYVKQWCPLPVLASPKPTPVATPSVRAVPQPVPSAQPAVRAIPAAAPAVKAVPAASPRAVASPSPAAVPVSTPTASVASVPKANPVAQATSPKPAVAATPAVKAAASVPAAAPAQASIFPEVELPADSLVGATIGDYIIEAKIGQTSLSGIYRAVQKKMNRKVRFYALDTKNNPPETQIEKFRLDAVAKAKVKQAFIFSVFEAGEADGVLFYSTEYLPGRTLEQLAESGQKLDGTTALAVLKVATDALQYLEKNNIPHNVVTGKSVVLTGPTQVRLANIATAETETKFQDSTNSRQALGVILHNLLAPNAEQTVPGISELTRRLSIDDPGLQTWDAVRQEVIAVTPKSRIADAEKLEAKENARIKALEEARKRQRKSVLLTGLTSLILLAVAFSVLYWALFQRGSSYKTFDKMIEIPAGPFVYQDGQTVELPRFWIAEHPVTIGQYAEFLAWLEENPDRINEVRHPDAPTGKTFIPQDWADSEAIDKMPGYYTRARRWGKHRSVPLNLDSPVFGVDYYDAWAYAKWKGMRLPTEQEWEKAARGTDGFLYPWGNEPRPEWVNSGSDFNPNPEKGGEKDGWKRWNPVDAMSRDRSPFGVMGMAGNVSEWTDSWDESQHLGMKVPVIRGGNYQNPDYTLTRRLLLRMAIQNDEVLGFRLASSEAPDQVKPLNPETPQE